MKQHPSGLPIETVHANLTRVLVHKKERIDSLEAKIKAVGVPHDLKIRLQLERDQQDLAVLKLDYERTAKQLADL